MLTRPLYVRVCRLNAIQYTIKNKGLATEEQYPYTGKDGHCKKHLANERSGCCSRDGCRTA